MKILAIETSCDDTAAAVVENGRNILSSRVSSQIEEHKIYGGVVPEIASRRHIELITQITKSALDDVNLNFENLDALAVTYAPGLIGSLLVGVNFAKGLSLATDLPLVPVHHLKSHIASLYLTYPELEPPFLCLVISGGHTHIVEIRDYTKMIVLGKTRDDAAGEAFDKVGRCLGLSYPGGVNLDKIAQTGDPQSFKLPHPLSSDNRYDFSFSGLKTAAINIINKINQKKENLPVANMAASFRASVVKCLVDNFIKCAEDLKYNKLAISGGVSANTLLRNVLELKCQKRGFKFFKPLKNLCGDNAAMVGSQGYYEFLKSNIADFSLNAYASMPIDTDYAK